MNKFKTLSTLCLTLLTLVSCNELDELTEFDVSQNLNATLRVDITEDSGGEPQSWSDSTTIDISDNAEIQANLDLIESVMINSLTFKILNFEGEENAMVTEASISFGDTTIDVEDINLNDNTTIYNLGTTAQLNTIANTLKDVSEITIAVSGTVSSTPVKFDVIISLDVTTTINIL
jgi:hypothetical protein